jgi:hypothetical protein
MNIKAKIEELKSQIDILEQQLLELPKELPFEIAPKISEKTCTRSDAISYCEFLGNGWRLPTIDEFDLIYDRVEHDFEKDYYWSSTEYNGFYWYKNMANGKKNYVSNNYGCKVRPVRDTK